MAFELLKYESGVPRAATGPSRGEQISGVLSQLSKLVKQDDRMQQVVSDREAKKAAMSDVVRDAVDPFREVNDLAYAGVTVREGVHGQARHMMSELANPASDMSRMTPKELQEFLQTETDNFYQENSRSPHADMLAEVFSRETLKLQPNIVAAHAKQYKETRRQGLATQASSGIASMPLSIPADKYDVNMKAFRAEYAPGTIFTDAQWGDILMSGAMAAADKGDPRPLEHAIKYNNADVLHPGTVNTARSLLIKAEKRATAAAHAEEYIDLKTMSEEGTFTEELWQSLIRRIPTDPHIAAIGRSGIDALYWGGRTNGRKARIGEAGSKAFDLGQDTNILDNSAFSKMVEGKFENALGEDAAESAKRDTPYFENQIDVINKLAASGRVAKGLKDSFSVYFGRPMYNTAYMQTPAFDKNFTLMRALEERMTGTQFKKQVGTEARVNYNLMKEAMLYTDGDYDKAAEIVVEQNNSMKALGADWKMPAVPEEAMEEATSMLFSGTHEYSDESIKGHFFKKGGVPDAMYTGMVSSRLRTAIKPYLRRGVAMDRAMEFAMKDVAPDFKVFGNELQDTKGADLGELFGFGPGDKTKEMQTQLEILATALNTDAKDLHIRVAGSQMYVSDAEGTQYKPVPLTYLGEFHMSMQAAIDEQNTIDNAHDEAIRQGHLNDNFITRISNQYGNYPEREFLPGVTQQMFDVADAQRQSQWRRQFYQEQFVILHKMAVHMVSGIERIKGSPERAKIKREVPVVPVKQKVFRGKGAAAVAEFFSKEK